MYVWLCVCVCVCICAHLRMHFCVCVRLHTRLCIGACVSLGAIQKYWKSQKISFKFCTLSKYSKQKKKTSLTRNNLGICSTRKMNIFRHNRSLSHINYNLRMWMLLRRNESFTRTPFVTKLLPLLIKNAPFLSNTLIDDSSGWIIVVPKSKRCLAHQ